jgi:hypothetical protein
LSSRKTDVHQDEFSGRAPVVDVDEKGLRVLLTLVVPQGEPIDRGVRSFGSGTGAGEAAANAARAMASEVESFIAIVRGESRGKAEEISGRHCKQDDEIHSK